MSRVVHLDQHVSRVQAGTLDLLDSPNCNLLVLSDLQKSVLAQMTFPYVNWDTRLVLDHGQYQETVDFPQLYKDELECLELLLSGGATMSCDLSTVLAELAAAIRNQPTGAGSCAYTGPSAVLNCLPGMTPGELIPQVPTEAPEYGVPPAGFDTWAEYLIHKCKAAWAVYDTVYGLFGALASLPILQITVTLIGTVLGGYIAGAAFGAAAFPPAAIIAIAAMAVAIGLLDAQAYIQFLKIQDYLRAHQEDIVCGLYTSGSASEALAGLAAELEDAIQSVEWAALFGGVIGPQLAAAVGAMAGEAETNNLVNPLFSVMEDFAYPDVSCCGGGPFSGPTWHFTMSDEGWYETFFLYGDDEAESYWANSFSPADPEDVSVGLLYGYIDRPDALPQIANIRWQYDIPVAARPLAVAGDKLKADFYCDIYEAAYVTLYAVYDDESSDTHTWGGTVGWNEREIEATPGKTLASVVVYFSVAEAVALRHFAFDNVRWGQ